MAGMPERTSTSVNELSPGVLSVVSELRRLTEGRKALALLQVVVSFIEGACEAAILTLFARLALRAVEADSRTVFVPGLGDRSLTVGVVLLVVLICGRLIAGLFNTFLSSRFQFDLVRAIRHEALDAYSSSSWMGQSALDDGALQQLVVTVPNGVSGQLAGLINHVGHVVIMVAMLSYSMATDVQLTTLLIFVIIGSTVLFRPLRTLIKRSAGRALNHQEELSSSLAQFGAVRLEIQSFGLAKAASGALHCAIDSDARQGEHLGRLKGSVVPLFTTVTYLAVALSIVILINTDAGTLERTGPILLVVLRSLSYGTAIQQAAASLASLRPSLEFLQTRTSELVNSRIHWGDKNLGALESCRLEGVTFIYPGAEQAALREAYFEIAQGTRIGLVGPSGGGKSTTTRIILGLLQPQEGTVLVNGYPLHQYDRASWSRQIGVVPQSAQVISGSIAENLRFYRRELTEDDLWEALEIADLRREVAAMPEGLATKIGPGNRALSGGQQQRLAIARAFAGKPRLVVLDEPTSSIDVVSEASISDAMTRMPDEVTLIIVSHRPKILEDCDVLVTVEDGRITGIGEPKDLLESSPYLRSLSWGAE